MSLAGSCMLLGFSMGFARLASFGSVVGVGGRRGCVLLGNERWTSLILVCGRCCDRMSSRCWVSVGFSLRGSATPIVCWLFCGPSHLPIGAGWVAN